MLTLAAIKYLFYYSRIIEILLYFFVENILLIAVLLSVFYFIRQAFLQLHHKKQLKADLQSSNKGKLL